MKTQLLIPIIISIMFYRTKGVTIPFDDATSLDGQAQMASTGLGAIDKILSGSVSSRLLVDKKYDFIVIGGGTAGSIVSARLAKKYNVLLIEAGGEPYMQTETPVLALKLLHNPDIDYGYNLSTVDNVCLGKVGGYCKLPAGKGLGGSSLVNFMIFTRGHPSDFDEWDDPKWSYASLIPFFKRSETYVSRSSKKKKSRGYTGKIRVSIAPFIGMAEKIIIAAREFGLPVIEDVNVPFDGEGGSILQFNIDEKGKRLTPFRAYTSPLRMSPNLTICKFCTATKILINQNKEAIGVVYNQQGKLSRAYANNEVIISAGSIESPKLLLLSGIGSKEDLKKLKIKLVQDLPTGKNLQDHVSTLLGPYILNSSAALDVTRDLGPDEMAIYTAFGKGKFTSPGVSSTVYLRSSYAKKRYEKNPDIQLLLVTFKLSEALIQILDKAFRIQKNVLRESLKDYTGYDMLAGLVVCSRPKSRGSVKLNEDNIMDEPIINTNYYDKNEDLKIVIEGHKTATDIFTKTPTFKKLNSTLVRLLYPACKRYKSLKSSGYIECLARHFTQTVYHPVGTCKMGKNTDITAVVNNKLQVKGIKKLRVIDASIMPTTLSTNTHAAVIAIAEYGSQLILDSL